MSSITVHDVGLLVLRLGFAGLIFGHATQKLFGWFRGGGPAGSGRLFETWGFRPGTQLAVVAGTCELAGAASVTLGLLTPGGCALLVGTMIVAASPAARNGIWAHMGGNEVPVVYAFLAAVIALTGPGQLSIDDAAGLHWLVGPGGYGQTGWGIGAIVLGVAASIPMLLRRQAALRADAVAAPSVPSESADKEVTP